MKNFYENSEMRLPEKVIALEDFTYGSYVKCSIPALTPFLENKLVTFNTERLNTSNIENKDYSKLEISTYSNCNYVRVFIPKLLEDNEEGIGHKGDSFVCIFIGGDINKISVVGRC